MFFKHRYIFIGLIFFILFLIFSYMVHKNLFVHTDFDITIRLQDHIPRRLDGFFSILSIIGRAETMTVVLGIILLIRHRIKGLLVVLGYIIIHIFELYGKYFVNHPPPPQFMLRTQYPVNFPQFYVSTQYSYPSGHAARAMFITLLVAFLVQDSKQVKKEVKWCIYIVLGLYDIAMLVSRPYLGEHWTTDIIGGALIGISAALFLGRFI